MWTILRSLRLLQIVKVSEQNCKKAIYLCQLREAEAGEGGVIMGSALITKGFVSFLTCGAKSAIVCRCPRMSVFVQSSLLFHYFMVIMIVNGARQGYARKRTLKPAGLFFSGG